MICERPGCGHELNLHDPCSACRCSGFADAEILELEAKAAKLTLGQLRRAQRAAARRAAASSDQAIADVAEEILEDAPFNDAIRPELEIVEGHDPTPWRANPALEHAKAAKR